MEKKAEYQISTSLNEGILEIVSRGKVTEKEVSKMANEVISIILENGVENVVSDIRLLKGRFSYFEAYERVRNYPKDNPKVKVAIVDLPENAEYGKYLETTALNAGLSWKWFTDIDAARDWLKSKQRKVNTGDS